MDGFYVSDRENKGIGDKEARVFLGSARKKLADISNFQPKLNRLDEDVNPRFSDEYIVKLQKENMALLQILAERNKLIELSGIEVQKHRLNLQKMQQQNLQLAQVNNQMLAELNESKERLIVLKHELDCKNAMVKASKFSEETEAAVMDKLPELQPVGKCGFRSQQSKKRKLSRIRSDSGRFSSLSADVEASEASNERRDLFEADTADARVMHDGSSHEDEALYSKGGQERSSNLHECGDAQRPSVGRPRRRAAGKVQSYKESPLNTEVTKAEKVAADQQTAGKRELELQQSMRRKLSRIQSNSDAQIPSVIVDDRDHDEGLYSKEGRDEKMSDVYECGDARRPSVGRPQRRAAEKVQSYKEVPLNVKMRRPE